MSALFLPVTIFLPLLFSCPLGCSSQALQFGLLVFAIALVDLGSLMVGNRALSQVLFCCCSVLFSFCLFSVSDDRRGHGADTRPGSGVAGMDGGQVISCRLFS